MDHNLVSTRISSPTAPEIGRGRWAVPTRLIKNRTIKAEIQKLGCELERHMGNITPNNPNQNNPQVLLRDFKTRVRKMARCHEKRIQPMIKMKIAKLSEKLSQITNDPNLPPNKIKILSTQIKKEIQCLMKESHRQNRDMVSAIDMVEGEKIGKTWSNCFRESKPRDTIKCLHSPKDNTLTYTTLGLYLLVLYLSTSSEAPHCVRIAGSLCMRGSLYKGLQAWFISNCSW